MGRPLDIDNWIKVPVKSDTHPNETYDVYVHKTNLNMQPRCTCPGGQKNYPCKHLFRAKIQPKFKSLWHSLEMLGRDPKSLWELCLKEISEKEKRKPYVINRTIQHWLKVAEAFIDQDLKVLETNVENNVKAIMDEGDGFFFEAELRASIKSICEEKGKVTGLLFMSSLVNLRSSYRNYTA